MEQLLLKIHEVEKEATNLLKLQQRDALSSEMLGFLNFNGKRAVDRAVPDVLSFTHWIQRARMRAGEWTAGPLVVLSLFDGIGGIWRALSALGIPFIGYSCEVNNSANEVLKVRCPAVHHVGDVMTLQRNAIPDKVDLVVGGFPCQDLSSMGHRRGLHGQRSRLFFDMLRVIKIFKPTWFLAENVASMAWQDRDEISKHLNTIPIEIDSQELTPSRRRRMYWSNIPYPKKIPKLRDHESTSLQSVLKNATALDSKIGVSEGHLRTLRFQKISTLENREKIAESKAGPYISCILSQNTAKRAFGALELMMDNSSCQLRYISVIEVEKALGFPANYTNVNFHGTSKKESYTSTYVEQTSRTKIGCEISLRNRKFVKSSAEAQAVEPAPSDGLNRSLRWSLLGNTFSVNVIAYLLSPLLERAGRSVLKPITLPKSVREQDCSAMDSGEVWALYNSHERPNWYALIVSRTGDRFVQNPEKKKSPIRIEVRFLEMTDAYAQLEHDEWDTLSGTGLYRVRDVTDSQNSWIAFSHRMDNFLKYDDLYFIYPSKDEVWAVCDNSANTRYLVFVLDSYIDRSRAKQGKPGKECFRARCRLLQKVDTEFYRILEKEIDYTELSAFAFRAPYIYKNESNFLKIELTSRQRAARPDYFKQQQKRRRKYSDPSSSSDGEADEMAADDVALAEIMRGDDAEGLENCLDSSSSPLSNGFM